MNAALTADTLPLFATAQPRHPEAGTGAPDPDDLGDWVLLERNLTPQEAQVLAGCLEAAGIAAQAGDTGIVQTHSLMAIAVGGACLRVHQAQWQEAREVLAAFRRGEFDLGDDFDVGNPAG